MFERLSASGEVPSELMLHSTHVKARRSANSAKKGGVDASGGVSRGGPTSKVPCLAGPCGRPVAFGLTPGNVADINMAVPLLERIAPARRPFVDEVYNADRLRPWLAKRCIAAVIPSTASRYKPYPLNRRAYRCRNQFERLFCQSKNWRRIVTGYDRLARNYLPGLALVAIVSEWIV